MAATSGLLGRVAGGIQELKEVNMGHQDYDLVFCPSCGARLISADSIADMGKHHEAYDCPTCNWEATYEEGREDQLLHICPNLQVPD